MTDARDIAALLEIAHRAIDLEDRSIERRDHQAMLNSAYVYYKRTNGIEAVERDTTEWDAMISATKSEYDDAETAKRAEYNAKRRLQTAIRRYRAKAFA